MKYLKTIADNHYYQRTYPKRLLASCERMGLPKNLVKPLGLTIDRPEHEVAKAVADWNDVYDDVCQMIENSDSASIGREVRKRMALSFIKAQGLEPGTFEKNPDGTSAEYLDEAMDGLFGVDLHQEHPQYIAQGTKPKFSEEFIKTTYDLLTASVASEERITFATAIDKYLASRRRKQAAADLVAKDERFCRRFLTTVGDHLLTTENAGRYLKDYRNIIEGEYKGSTAARMVGPPRAALTYAADKFCTDVFIPKISIENSSTHEERYTLTESEIVKLIRIITDPKQRMPDYIRLFYAVAVHAGAHLKEIRNTRTSDLQQSDGGYQVFIRGAKTSSRPRTVPLLDEAVPFIKKMLPPGENDSLLAGAGDVTDSAMMRQLSKVMRLVNPEAVPYSLRHGVRNLAIAHGVGTDVQQLLLGWSDGNVGRSQSRYAASGEANADQMAVKRQGMKLMLQGCARVFEASALA